MATQTWDRDRVVALAAGAEVYLRSSVSDEVPAPDWLLAGGAIQGRCPVDERVRNRHPDDLQTVVDTVLSCFARPGELLEMQVRTLVDDAWMWERVQFVNLLDEPAVGCVVAVHHRLGEASSDVAAQRSPTADFEPTAWVVAVLDAGGTITAIEGMVEATLGFTAAALVGRPVTELISPDDRTAAVAAWVTFAADPTHPQTGRQRLIRADGAIVNVESTLMCRPGREVAEVALIWQDITRQLEQEAALTQLADEFRLLAEQVPAAVFRADGRGAITFCNTAAQVMFGLPGATLPDLVASASRPAIEQHLRDLAAGTDERAIVEVAGSCEGVVLSIVMRGVGTPGSDTRSIVGSVTDISTVASLRHLADRDPLTGLLNRRAIEEHVALAAGNGGEAVVVFIDLDGFKAVNDEHGHDAGDAVLVEIGRRLELAVRPDDAVGRYGGDEFVLVCPNPRANAEQAIRRRIEAALTEPIVSARCSWLPLASIGTAVSRPGEAVEAVIARADQAMFAIKREHHRSHPRGATRLAPAVRS